MFGIGLPEMLVILAVALIVVGPDKLPELARSLAKGVMDLKKTAETVKEGLVAENPLPDIKNDLKAGLPNLADFRSDLPELPNLHEAAKRLREQVLDTQAEEVKALPEKMEDSGAQAANEDVTAMADADEDAPARIQAAALEGAQPDAVSPGGSNIQS
ncbi:MAG TPA: hypothetical protein DEB25_02295 [Desulfobulbaceae bacterium]|nr:hypothetical protein [Desulfobulbaceae bacterium]